MRWGGVGACVSFFLIFVWGFFGDWKWGRRKSGTWVGEG